MCPQPETLSECSVLADAIRDFYDRYPAVSVFPDELYPAPRSWAERAYPKLIHYNKLDKGGHFAALEQPKLFSEEVRSSFRSLRKSVSHQTAA
jgi:pimeloyl-ACP methyl ester carboxylesterase